MIQDSRDVAYVGARAESVQDTPPEVSAGVERDRRTAAGDPHPTVTDLTELSTWEAELALGLALRADSLERLSQPAVRVAVITAPAGYGKTSHAAAWAAQDHRAVVWIDIEDRHNDALVLLTDLVAMLSAATDFRGDGLVADGSTCDQYTTDVARRLGRALRSCTRPFLLVLDDVHRVTDFPATDLIEALVSNVPPTSTVLLVGRACRLHGLARLRVGSTCAEIGTDDLALDAAGATIVLADMGLEPSAEQAEQVIADTEGWPVGVRLFGIAVLVDAQHRAPVPTRLRGREASVRDYIRSEWLWGLTDADRDFLMRVSVLDWLSGPLCDEVLGRRDTADVLHRIFSDRLLLIPLDRTESAYRMHGLLRDALAAELERLDPAALRDVHERASEWYEQTGDVERAIRHAFAAPDLDRAERLIIASVPAYYTNGHYTTIDRWIDAIARDRVLGNAALCLSAALAALGLGDRGKVAVWLRLGEQAATSPAGSDAITRLCLLDLRSTVNTGPVGPALDAAATAYRGLPPCIWHAAACLAYGAWSWTVGDDIASKVLTEGADEAAVLGAPALESYCTAMLAIIAHTDGDLAGARVLAGRARRVALDHGLEQAPGMAIVSAVSALVAAESGDAAKARGDWHLARAQLALLKDLSGWANVQTRVALAHTSLLLGDRTGAETLLREAHELLVQQPDATRAIGQVAKLDELVRHMRRHSSIGSSALTTAELRVLHYLPTNLTLADIGTRLYVSRYTIKTHCETIYRKLNVNSRAEAVESARRIGLLDDRGSDIQ